MGESRILESHGDSANPVLWRRACELFHAALELDPEAREAFVASACGDDEDLRQEVRSLLASDLKAGDFIERPATALLARSAGHVFTPRLVPGTDLGRYEVLEFLGAGGMSQVYRARDSHLGRIVALKLVTDPEDTEAASRLLVEAQHASILNHPNICVVHEAENDQDLPFIVLELVDGPTLSKVLKERRASMQEVLKWGQEIAAALAHAHRHGVVHRDLKSTNVALSPDGTVKVLDFGLSRRIAAMVGASSPAEILSDASIAGTLTHIAPETLRGEPIDHRVDLWALGVMLYEMASGRLPFSETTALQTSDAILHTPPPPFPDDVPRDLQRVIRRCLAKDPAARFETAADLCDALGECDVAADQRAIKGRHVALGAVIVAATLGLWYAAAAFRSSQRVEPIIAVLPLENIAADEAQQFYVDGVTEALVGELGRIDGIRVIAPAASMQRRTSTAALRKAALNAGANRLLEGSVVRDATSIRLTARIIDASSSAVLWSDVYQRSAREVMALQTEVAQAVARAVHIELSSEDATRFSTVRAVDPDVYEAYLKGRYHWNQRTSDSLRAAVEYFEAALKLDPTYAPAYAALADCYNQFATNMVGGGPPRVWRPKAAEAAVKALQIDPNLAEAHATLAYVRHYDWQWEDAETSFLRAISLNPNNPLAHIWYANFLCSRLRLDEAVGEVRIALELDPLSLIVNTNVGWVLYYARRTDAAIEQFKKTLALDPTYQQAQSRLATAYLDVGRYDEAIALSTAIAQATGSRVGSLASVEQAKLRAGRPNELERLLDETVTRPGARYLSPGAIAEYYFALGHRDEDGFRWLQDSYNERTNNMAYLAVSPTYDRVRSDPRFKALVKAVGLP